MHPPCTLAEYLKKWWRLDHLLWWLWLFYRKPSAFFEEFKLLSIKSLFAFAFFVYFYFIVFATLLLITIYPLIGNLIFDIVTGIVAGLAVGLVYGIALLRYYYHLMHIFFIFPVMQARWYPIHPVAWDDMCRVPFSGLEKLLIAYTDYAPEKGQLEIERLIEDYPAQKIPALKAKIILIAKKTEAVQSMEQIYEVIQGLPEGEQKFLKQIPRLREKILELAKLEKAIYVEKAAYLQKISIQGLIRAIENFRSQIQAFEYPIADSFTQASKAWQATIEVKYKNLQTIQEAIPLFFRAGDPVNRSTEAFRIRYAVIEELQKQILLSTGCPSLIIYARRRMGKTSLLNNLLGILSNKIIIVPYISMLDARSFTSLASWIETIFKSISKTLKANITLEPSLINLSHILTKCNLLLQKSNRKLLLSIDEYEMIDRKITEGIFPEELLSAIRESIQTHRQII